MANQRCQVSSELGGGNSNIFIFTPNTAETIQFDYFFQMGGSTNYSSECVNDIGKWSQLVNCTEALMAQELDESSEVVGKDQAGEENTWALWALRCREPMDSSPTWETMNYIYIYELWLF